VVAAEGAGADDSKPKGAKGCGGHRVSGWPCLPQPGGNVCRAPASG
jgi:hypothetical protein